MKWKVKMQHATPWQWKNVHVLQRKALPVDWRWVRIFSVSLMLFWLSYWLRLIQANALCIGNIDEKGAQHVTDVVAQHFLNPSRPLHDAESPKFKSMKLPTKEEAISIFGPEITTKTIPVKYQELAFSQSEENNAVEVTLQAGCDSTLTYEGIGILDLITNMAYNSAYNQLRTK